MRVRQRYLMPVLAAAATAAGIAAAPPAAADGIDGGGKNHHMLARVMPGLATRQPSRWPNPMSLIRVTWTGCATRAVPWLSLTEARALQSLLARGSSKSPERARIKPLTTNTHAGKAIVTTHMLTSPAISSASATR